LLRGIGQYARLHGPWSFLVVSDQLEHFKPPTKSWDCACVISRLNSPRLVKAVNGTKVFVILVDCVGNPLAQQLKYRIADVVADSQGVARLAAEYFSSRRFEQFAFVGGSVDELAPERLAEFVTEAGNPGNRRLVAVVDVLTPAMRDLPDVRLVDTPGLGSVFTHNTEVTRAWMPNAAAAIVTVSAERPLSEEDLRLVAEARQTAPRVVVLLTKVDLLTHAERAQVVEFLEHALNDKCDTVIPVLPFSARVSPEKWLHELRESLLLPVAQNVAEERRAALVLKLNAVAQCCRDYLSVAIEAAERSDADRDRLRTAVFNEQVSVAVIRDELTLAEQGIRATTRPAFEKYFLGHHSDLRQRVSQSLAAEFPSWQGNLAKQARRYEDWMNEFLSTELMPLSAEAASVGRTIIGNAEERLRRIVEAFRDRLNRNIHEATGVSVSPLAWEAMRPELKAIPVNVGQTFMIHWELLWWLLPMQIVSNLFRRHAIRRASGEVETNLRRLVSDWSKAAEDAVADLRRRAMSWVEAELATLDQLLRQLPGEAAAYHDAVCELERIEEA
ncbi:MAG: dynamin family protein, partial [Pirellulales bacterium]